MSTALPPFVDGDSGAVDVSTPSLHRVNRRTRPVALSTFAAVVGVAAAFGFWDATTGVWVFDLLVWGGLGAAFVALVDGIVTLLKWLLVGLLSVLPTRAAARRARHVRTSPLSFSLSVLWFAFGWRLCPTSRCLASLGQERSGR